MARPQARRIFPRANNKYCDAAVVNTPIFWDASHLAAVKSRLEADYADVTPAYDALITRAIAPKKALRVY